MIEITEFQLSRIGERLFYFIWPYALGSVSFLIGCMLVIVACLYIPYTSMGQAKYMAFLVSIGSVLVGIGIGIVWYYGIEKRKEFWGTIKQSIIETIQAVFPWPFSKDDWQTIHWMRRGVAFILFLGGVGFAHDFMQWSFNPDLYNFAYMSPIAKCILLFGVALPFGVAGLLLLPDVIKLLKRRKI